MLCSKMKRVQCILELGQAAHARDYTRDEDLCLDEVDEADLEGAREALSTYNAGLQVNFAN